jgi:hypothetical protein
MITVDRAQPRQYSDGTRRAFSVSTVCATMTGEPSYGTEADMQRGTDLHVIFALAVAAYAGRCAPPSVPPEYRGYYQSMHAWIDAFKPEPIHIERPSLCVLPGLPFAGTPDLMAWISHRGKRVLALPDLKSGLPARWHRVQVLAYSKLELYRAATSLGLIYLHDDGTPATYQHVPPKPRDWAAFQSALNLLIWRETT